MPNEASMEQSHDTKGLHLELGIVVQRKSGHNEGRPSQQKYDTVQTRFWLESVKPSVHRSYLLFNFRLAQIMSISPQCDAENEWAERQHHDHNPPVDFETLIRF